MIHDLNPTHNLVKRVDILLSHPNLFETPLKSEIGRRFVMYTYDNLLQCD